MTEIEERIPVAGPWITELEIEYAADAARNAWYARAGEYNQRFEEAFAHAVGRRYAVSLPHATSGLHLALAALGIGEGDEVIVPDATWIASAAPISYVGATTVFADIDATTWGLCPRSFETCISERTRAVIPVDLYGSMPNLDAIGKIAAAHGVAVIEDAAEAFGSTLGGRPAGSFGEASFFSFHGSKTLTTGEGGMLVLDREDLLDRVRVLRDHGRAPGDRYFQNKEVAFKYKMSALQAAVGLAQLERAEELVARKREIFASYHELLRDVTGIQLNPEPEGTQSSYWMVTVVQVAEPRLPSFELMKRFDERGIDTRPFFAPLSSLDAYAAGEQALSARARNQVAYGLCPWGVNLPSGYNMTPERIERVVKMLIDILSNR